MALVAQSSSSEVIRSDLELADDWVVLDDSQNHLELIAPKEDGFSFDEFVEKNSAKLRMKGSEFLMSLKKKKTKMFDRLQAKPSFAPIFSLLKSDDLNDEESDEEEERLTRSIKQRYPKLSGSPQPIQARPSNQNLQDLQSSIDHYQESHRSIDTVSEVHIEINDDLSSSAIMKRTEPKPRPLPSLESDEAANLAERKMAEEKQSEALVRQLLMQESCCDLCQEGVSSSKDKENHLFVVDCEHRLCFKCLRSHFEKFKPLTALEVRCPVTNCEMNLPHRIFKRVLTDEEFNSLLDRLLHQAIEKDQSFVHCPQKNCSFVMERISMKEKAAEGSGKEVDRAGKPLSLEAQQHRDEFRFRCRACSTEFCAECKRTPYHLGFTCQQYEEHLNAVKCRFCGSSLDPALDRSPVFEVCLNEECQRKLSLSCKKTHQTCGHACNGIDNETECLPCLSEECVTDKDGVTKDDYCNICWIEDLGSAPCIKLECGHIFHSECVRKKIQKKWNSARITFAFVECPLCKKWISHSSLQTELQPIKLLYDDIKTKALKRLEFEGLQSDPEIDSANGRYYKNPLGYAMDRFAYYPCYQCGKPYFGGQRRCDAGERDPDSFDPKELVCPRCSGVGDHGCTIHGDQFIEHKCQYCCSIASWYCWGKTHFCDSCHFRQQKGDYITKYAKERHPKCPGKEACPLKIDHPPNGEPHVLGCAICKELGGF